MTHRLTILALALLRLLWRWSNPTPSLPAGMPSWKHFLAHDSHVLLYGLLFVMPRSGWLMSSARGFSVAWFKLFTFPDLIAELRSAGTVNEQRETEGFPP